MPTIPTVSFDPTAPAGSEARSLGDNRIRELKVQVQEILNVDHYVPASGQGTTWGQHRQVTLQEQADLPTGAVGATIVGSQTVSGKGELCYVDEDDNTIQITTGGKINAAAIGGTYACANVAALASILNFIYPVGTVLTFGVSTNPATLLGIGTWTAIAGKVIVGIDGGQTEFDTLDETGGEKAHTLSIGEIPFHQHSITIDTRYDNSGAGFANAAVQAQAVNGSFVNQSSGFTGGGGAHNNLQPYIVKYVWQRTA